MKTTFLKTVMPVIAFIFAIAAAFATHAKVGSSAVLVDAYIPVEIGGEIECQDTPIQCDTNILPNICTYNGQQAFGLENQADETSCTVDLYRQ